MEILNLEGTADTPKIVLDKTKEIFEISGRSLPENAAEFYTPVLAWLREYAADPNPVTEIIFNLEYINTASSKRILDILTSIENIKSLKIVWCFQDDDEDMEEAGEEFSELVKIPFEFRSY